MKRLLILLLAVILSLSILVGCGGESKEPETQAKQEEVSRPEPKEEKSQDEINQELKEEAVKAVFTEINGNEDADGIKVYAEGEISIVDYDNIMDLFPSFILSQSEGDGYGMYHITNVLSHEGLKDGDIVIAYGVVDGVSDSGIPKIVSTLIEIKEELKEEEEEEEDEGWDSMKTRENIIGKSDKDYLEVTDDKPSDVRNDSTGKWKITKIAESINIEQYALSYKDLYMKDGDVHWIVNFNYNTTTRISYTGGLLFVDILEYQSKEEHDANKLGTEMVLKSYLIYPDGDIEEVES